MPTFELVSLADAEINSATGKRAQIIREYMGYIDRLPKGQAGKLVATEGETAGAVRRRLGAAAKLAGKDLVIRRADDGVYFWIRSGPSKSPRRRGGARKDTPGS